MIVPFPFRRLGWPGFFQYALTVVMVSAFAAGAVEADEKPVSVGLWSVWTVDTGSITGSKSSCAFLPSGEPVIGYDDRRKNELKWARLQGERWTISTIAKAIPYSASLAVKGTEPVVAYVDHADKALKLATLSEEKWTVENLDPGQRYMAPASVVCHDRQMRVWAWSLDKNALWTFEKSEGRWQSSGMGNQNGFEVSGATDGKGTFACVSNHSNRIALSMKQGGKWVLRFPNVGGRVHGPNALCFDSKSRACMAVSGLGQEGVKWVVLDDENWLTEEVEKGIRAESAAVAVSPQGQVAVVFIDRADLLNGILKVGRREKGRWVIEVLDRTAGGGYQTDIAFGPRGEIGVSFYDQPRRCLRFALRMPGGTGP